jgi:hypothetical protein
MKIYDTFPQYSKEYWAAHRGKPSASCFDSLITTKKMEYAASSQDYINQLIADMYDMTYPPVDQMTSAAMRHGIMAEPQTRRWVEMEMETTVRQVGLVESDDGKFVCSPDGLIDDEQAGLELKNPTAKVQVSYLRAGNVVPPQYLPQVHGSLLISGLKKWWFVSYRPDLPVIKVLVEPNEFTEKLRGYMDRFYAEFMAALETIKGM